MLIMKNYHRLILNFHMRDFEEALILKCFTDKENYLLFPYYGLDYYETDMEVVDYIQQRTLYVENNYIYWFHPQTIDEVTSFVKHNWPSYRCLIMTKEDEKMKIRFKLETYEHYEYNDTETRALIVLETEDEDYIRNIAPKIKEVIQNHNIGMRTQ